MSTPRDATGLPLDGIRVVEASAGTGKTFTIATLYLRLILERGLRPDEIVVATFTRAAAAELSTRLRQRLVVADTLLGTDEPGAPRAGDDGEHAETRKVIAQALTMDIPLDALRQRVRDARLAIDTAVIGTLHGFCHRVLAEFGFETGQALRQPELVDDIRELEAEIVRDFWRLGSADAQTAGLLAGTWGSPDQLAAQVSDPRWKGRDASVAEPDCAALRAAFEHARAMVAAWNATAIYAAIEALQACIERPSTLQQRIAALTGLHAWAKAAEHNDTADAVAVKQALSLGAKALDGINPKGKHAEGSVFDDVAALCTTHAACLQAQRDQQQLPAAHLLRSAREYLDAELPQRLAGRNLMSHDQAVDRLAAALDDSVRGKSAIAKIGTRWKAALIDEFQDTDARQWQVVRMLFGASTLVLVGDPKQAIYGFRGGDVFAWLQARAHAQGEPLRLTESYRAGEGLAQATNALFAAPGAFIETGIGHQDIRAAGPVAARALLRAGEPVPALQVWWLDPEAIPHSSGKLPSKAHATAAIQSACVAWIARLLDDPAVRLRNGDGGTGRLQPKHIAVLVNDNRQAHAMQAALGRAGVPASSNLRASVYTSGEAADLALLLDALAMPDDARRARAARASVLIGDDAATLAASVADDSALAALLEGVAAWADTVTRHGPLPWLHKLIADAAPRLLAPPDGQRRVANYLQLAERLQDLHAASFGVEDLAVRFARARVEADDDADSARLRLDTDTDAVTVATVHAAKGLEYDVVLVPYAVLGRDPDNSKSKVPMHWYHDGNTARVAIGKGANLAIVRRALEEIRAEDVRKFYVAVTRASALCVLPWEPVSSARFSPVFHLLHAAGRDPSATLPLDASGCKQALEELCAHADGAVQVVALPQPDAHKYTASRKPVTDLQVRAFVRTTLERDWQTWSFSRLVRGSSNQAAADPLPGSGDSDALSADVDMPHDDGLAGARFGTAVHAAFEQTDFAAWRGAPGVPDSERSLLERSLRGQGLADAPAAMQRAIDVAGACLHAALNALLPCGVQLCDTPPASRKAEIEFHLTLQPARSEALYALLHRHGYQRQRNGVAPRHLHGLLTGKIDLTFVHEGRFHIIDWKTNRCAPYDQATLDAEIAVHDYDLQWLLYTLALHRWLRQQLPDYAYDRHVGEVYYLFVRGMAEGRGVHVDRPPRGLIEAMDALFDARGQDHA